MLAFFKRWIKAIVYPLYEKRLSKTVKHLSMPKHVGVILDGNRRWAKSSGVNTEGGHSAGARKIDDLLTWCDEYGIEHVTLWMLSTDNFSRDESELSSLLRIVTEAIEHLADSWRLHFVGSLEVLPIWMRDRLTSAIKQSTQNSSGPLVNVAIGYGGRQEISDAVRALLKEHDAQGRSLSDVADLLTPDHISEHMYTKGQPDPDLIIRTSGEQRLSGFLLWQSAHSEYYFCEAFWPDFRRIDFLRAVRAFALRSRRFGT